MNHNGTKNAEYVKLYFQVKRTMTHPQIASAILQIVAEWNNEIEASIKKQPDLLTFFRSSKITGVVTVKSLTDSYLSGARNPPRWVVAALKEVVKRHAVPVKRHVKKDKDNESS